MRAVIGVREATLSGDPPDRTPGYPHRGTIIRPYYPSEAQQQMFQRILVSVDSSEISQTALAEAVGLAQALGATLSVAHVVDAVTANAFKGSDRDRFLAPQIASGRAILEKASALAQEAGVSCVERLLEIDALGRGRLPEAVVQEADAWEADLILVGTHGRSGVSHLLLGSVAQGIANLARKPVLVVPAKARRGESQAQGRYRSLLVAVDGTEISEPALQAAIALAQATQATLRLVYATDAARGDSGPAQGILDAALAKVQKAGVSVETETLRAAQQTSAIADAIVADAVACPADLIVLGTHARQGLDRLRQGSVAEGVVRQASVPVLLARSATGSAGE